MNTVDILKYGHYTVMGAIDGLEEAHWQTAGVCGVWSLKDIIAHLASYELFLIEILHSLLDTSTPTPLLEVMVQGPQVFNDIELGKRSEHSMKTVLDEYVSNYEQTPDLINKIPKSVQNQNGVLAWYGADYDLQDFIVYTFYGHKREHSAQINIFRDTLKAISE